MRLISTPSTTILPSCEHNSSFNAYHRLWPCFVFFAPSAAGSLVFFTHCVWTCNHIFMYKNKSQVESPSSTSPKKIWRCVSTYLNSWTSSSTKRRKVDRKDDFPQPHSERCARYWNLWDPTNNTNNTLNRWVKHPYQNIQEPCSGFRCMVPVPRPWPVRPTIPTLWPAWKLTDVSRCLKMSEIC